MLNSLWKTRTMSDKMASEGSVYSWSDNRASHVTREDQCARRYIYGGLGGDGSGAGGRSDDYCSDLVSGAMEEEEGTQ